MNDGYQVVGRALKRATGILHRIGGMRTRNAATEQLHHRDFFSISIFSGASPLEMRPIEGAGQPVLTAKDVTDVPAVYVADPFMIRVDECWHMYFEILCKEGGKGAIGLATSREGRVWDYVGVVLEEPFHLSYPCVFESAGEYYIIPESKQAGAVRLYKAGNFPAGWSFVGNLIENVEFVDCTPFRHGGKWWLFAGCGTPQLLADKLRLFSADELTGPWIEHPASPVITDNPRIARPAGRVVVWENRLLRFAQECTPRYGLRVGAFEITALTATTYRERAAAPEAILRESHHGWNAAGMHHMDCHRAEDGSWIACVDGWFWGPEDL